MIRKPIALVLAAVVTVGCSADPAQPDVCAGAGTFASRFEPVVDMVVSYSGSVPIFDWSPQCEAEYLAVNAVDATGNMTFPAIWGIDNTSLHLMPPVRYGVTPSGSVVVISGTSLVRGHAYVVTIGTHNHIQFGAGNARLIGQTNFTYNP